MAWQGKRARFATGQSVKLGTEVEFFTSCDAPETAVSAELEVKFGTEETAQPLGECTAWGGGVR